MARSRDSMVSLLMGLGDAWCSAARAPLAVAR